MTAQENHPMHSVPIKRLPYRFQQRVAWSDLDGFAHVNHTRFAIYFENARTQFFTDQQVWDTSTIQATGPVIHELNLQYRRQVRFPAQLDVTIGITSVGSRKFEMACTMWNEKDCVCVGHGEFLWIHFEQGRPMRLPRELVQVLGEYRADFSA